MSSREGGEQGEGPRGDVDPVGEERGVAVAGAADAGLEALLLHLRGALRRRPRRGGLRCDATH